MGAVANLQDADEILKDFYTDTEVVNAVSVDNPVLGLLEKRTDFVGRRAPLPLMIAPTSGVSPSFPDAQASKRATEYEDFMIETVDLFSQFSIDHKAAEAAKGEGTFVDYIEQQADGALLAWRKFFARYVFGNGGGALAQVESGGGTAEIVLTMRSDIHVFHKGNQIVTSTDDGYDEAFGGSGAGVIGSPRVIGGVRRRDRVLTLEGGGNWDATEFADGNFIFLRGGYGNCLHGLDAWLPMTAPSGGEDFNGVDRSTDDMLVGVTRVADKNEDKTVAKFIMNLGSDIVDMGGDPDLLLINGRTLTQVVQQLDNKVEYVREPAKGTSGKEIATVGYDIVRFVIDGRRIDAIAARHCRMDRVYMLTKKTWRLWSIGRLVGFTEYGDDTKRYVRHTQENAMEGRINGYMNMCCRLPAWNGVGDISELVTLDS